MKRATNIQLIKRVKTELKDSYSSRIFNDVVEGDIFSAYVKIQYGRKENTMEMILSVHEGEIIQIQHRLEIQRKLKTDIYQIKDIKFIKKLGRTNRNCGYTIIGQQDEKGKRNIKTGNYE